jgi:CBS domain-containing protein
MPVVVAGEAVGMLTDRDITIRIAAHGLDPQKTHVSDAMTEGVVACKEDDDVGIAARLMAENQIRRLIVVEDGANCPAWCLWEILRNTLTRNRTGL